MNNLKNLNDLVICPKTMQSLYLKDNILINKENKNIYYKIINNVPILINKDNSLFADEDYEKIQQNKSFKKLLIKILPNIGKNWKAKKNFTYIKDNLKKDSKVLIIGGGKKGAYSEILYNNKFNILVTDVMFTDEVDIINDAHNLCFKDNYFDCVVIQAVLEHVLSPHQCVKEIYRVLKDDGLVYAEVPFMQQVHMKNFDFTRFTHLGFLWLFKKFKEIESGPCCGPGMSFAWSYVFLLRSFSNNHILVKILTVFGYFTSFFFKYLD